MKMDGLVFKKIVDVGSLYNDSKQVKIIKYICMCKINWMYQWISLKEAYMFRT